MSEAIARKPRPKNLNVMELGMQLPVPGMVSILHRVSGVGIFLMLPFLLFLFDASVSSPESFMTYKSVVAHPLAKLLLLGLLWAYLHHFCAGIRFLLLDLHKGIELQPARNSSWAVIGVSLVLTVVIGVMLW